MLDRPVIVVVAGPNGSGKTTLTQQMQRQGWLGEATIINPDEIAQQQFGDWNSDQAVMQALSEAEKMRESMLAARQSFVWESVLSAADKLAFLARCKNAGYFIRFVYICTDDPGINVQRVQSRVMAGGHDVPADKIVSRYPKSLAHCSALLLHLDRGYVYDNSVENQAPKLMFRTSDGRVKKIFDRSHAWSNGIVKAMTAKL